MGKYRNFTEAERKQIIKEYRQGASTIELAIKFKCSANTISNKVFMYARPRGRPKINSKKISNFAIHDTTN